MAKDKKARPAKQLTKKQLSRHRREQRQLRWIWIAVGSMVAAIVLIVAIGLISQNTRLVATVNGQAIKATEYEKRVRYYYYSLGPDVFQASPGEEADQIHQLIVDQLIEEALIRQEAQKRDISATDQEIDVEVEEQWFQHYRDGRTATPAPTIDPAATATPVGTPPPATPTPDTPETFEANYKLFVNNVLKPARLGESYVRQMAEVNVLQEKLQSAIVLEVPIEEEQIRFRYAGAQDPDQAASRIAEFQAGVSDQVHARHILVATQEEAEAVLKRLEAGEDFAALAAELSTDPSNKDEGGDLGWFGRGMMVPEFEQAAYEGEIGLYPEPVQTDFGYHVIEVLERQERPIDLDQELYEVGWYGKSQMAAQFGPLFAEMVFDAEIGLLPNPVPTTYGIGIVEILERAVRTLDEAERASRGNELFQEWLGQVREEGVIEELWDAKMIPSRM